MEAAVMTHGEQEKGKANAASDGVSVTDRTVGMLFATTDQTSLGNTERAKTISSDYRGAKINFPTTYTNQEDVLPNFPNIDTAIQPKIGSTTSMLHQMKYKVVKFSFHF